TAQAAAVKFDTTKLPPATTRPIDFLKDIRPIFKKSCYSCHGPDKQKSGYRLDIKSAALKGGDDGVDIIPGHSDQSRLIHYVAGLVEDKLMPAKGEKLSSVQIGVLRAWIDQGAVWPDGVDVVKLADKK